MKYKLLNRMKIYDYINDANRLSREYDALIFLGGSIFREEGYWKELYEIRKKMLQAFKKKGKPVLVLGANFGPFYSKEFLDAYHQFFMSCDDVCFREGYSKQLFDNLPCIRNEADIVFQLGMEKREKKDQIVYSVIEPNHKEGIEKYRENYIHTISQSICNNIHNNFKCILMSFCRAEGDLKICKEIVKTLSDEIRNKVDVIDYDGDIEAMLTIIEESRLIIASRFHANILGLLCDTHILPLVYSDKTSNVLKEIGFENTIVKIEECEKILEKNFIQRVLSGGKQLKCDRDIFESSKRQFGVLEKILNIKR